MSCPHSLTDSPQTCSQCLGVKPRLVTQQDGDVLIDGVVERSIALVTDPNVPVPQTQRRRRNRGRK